MLDGCNCLEPILLLVGLLCVGWAWHGGGELGELWVFDGLVVVEGSSWADVVGWACVVDETAGNLVFDDDDPLRLPS